jgi:hypothetical protein
MLVWRVDAFSQPPSDREVIERLVRVEEGQRQLPQGLQQLGERLAGIEEAQRHLGERLTRVEGGQRGLEQRVEEGFAVVNRRIDELREFLLWGFGVTFARMFALVGFVIWDRRSALAPAVRRIQEMKLNQSYNSYLHKEPAMDTAKGTL